MDAVSRDALTETEQTLKDLAGFLKAVKEAPDGGRDPALEEIAVQIMGVATRLRVFVLGDGSQQLQLGSGRREIKAVNDVASRPTASREHSRSVHAVSAVQDQPALA